MLLPIELFCQRRNEAYEILERITCNNCQWWCEKQSRKKVWGVLEVDALTSINAQLASVADILQNLTLGQGSMTKAPVQTAIVMTQTTVESCVYCGE